MGGPLIFMALLGFAHLLVRKYCIAGGLGKAVAWRDDGRLGRG